MVTAFRLETEEGKTGGLKLPTRPRSVVPTRASGEDYEERGMMPLDMLVQSGRAPGAERAERLTPEGAPEGEMAGLSHEERIITGNERVKVTLKVDVYRFGEDASEEEEEEEAKDN